MSQTAGATGAGSGPFGGGVSLHLPDSRAALHDFHAELMQTVNAAKAGDGGAQWSPAVRAMAGLIDGDAVIRMYVEEMLAQVQALPGAPPSTVTTIEDLLGALNVIVTLAPLYNPVPSKRHAFPMSSLFAFMMMTVAGESLFRNRAYNGAIQAVLQEWCAYLNGADSASVLNDTYTGWISQSAIDEFELTQFVFDPSLPHGGWASYNEFFHRQIKLAEYRPVAAPDDVKVVVSANDGNLVSIARGVQLSDRFWLKGEPFSLVDMLNHSEYADRFVGGDVVQTFLSGGNYHRWRAPIAGTVRYAEVVDGLMFSDAESAGWDPNGVLSEGYYAAVNTRGLVFIESGDPVLGMVCVIPIGITEISSVEITVKAGEKVEKGDQLGYFSYGGSTLALVFEHGAIDHFTAPSPPKGAFDPGDGPPIQVNAQIAVANV